MEIPGAVESPRSVYSNEFIWVRCGTGTARIGRKRFRVKPNDILFIPVGAEDSYRWSDRQYTSHGFLHFDLHPKWAAAPRKWPTRRHFKENALILDLFRYFLGFNTYRGSHAEQTMIPIADLILRLFLDEPTDYLPLKDPGLPVPIERSLLWINDRLASDPGVRVTLLEIARQVHVSPPHLCRLFKRFLGVGPVESVNLLRLERAASLLEQSRSSIKEISHACGFSNPYHFSRAFHRIYTLSPRSYREAFKSEKGFRPESPILRNYPFQTVSSNPDTPQPTAFKTGGYLNLFHNRGPKP